MIAATSAEVDWRIAARAIAAAAEVTVAAVVVGGELGADEPVRERLAGLVELGEVDQVGLERARDLVVAAIRAYDLVLVGADTGLLVPIGRDGWTPADLAAEVNAPVVVVTGPGPDAVNHTTLALGALAGHGIIASVVTIGEVDEAALPVAPSGRIPAAPGDFGDAGEWLEPMLRATARPAPAAESAPAEPRRTTSGKRIVLALAAVFVVMVVTVCGLAWFGRGPDDVEYRQTITARTVLPPLPRATVPMPTARRRTAADVCPENGGPGGVTKPDAATTARVNAAWARIEKWLRGHAPASAKALRPGASAAAVDDLQRRMSVAFPADLVASLRRHDGVARGRGFSLPPFYTPDTLTEILADWRVNCGVMATENITWADDAWWHRDFVPFAAAGDGGSLVVDQRDGGHGRVGEFFAEDGTTFERWPGSVAELLELTAGSLETGKPFAGHYRPRVDENGALDWEIS